VEKLYDILNKAINNLWFYNSEAQIYFKVLNFPDKIIVIDAFNGKLDDPIFDSIDSLLDIYLESEKVLHTKTTSQLDFIITKSLLLNKHS
jgi:hypothetical protein